MIQKIDQEHLLGMQMGLVIVVSDWCHVCRSQWTAYVELSKALHPQFVYYIDLQDMDHATTAKMLGDTTKVPCFLIFKDGEIVSRMSGDYDVSVIQGAVNGWMQLEEP